MRFFFSETFALFRSSSKQLCELSQTRDCMCWRVVLDSFSTQHARTDGRVRARAYDVQRVRFRFATLLWLILLGTANSTTPSSLSAQRATSHDSGSVKVILLPSRRRLSANLSLATTGTPRGGGLTDNIEDELGHRNGYLNAFMAGNETLVALDGARLRFYSADGTLAATLSRPGAGPGEARLYTSGCATRGDSVAAFDNGTRRMTVATRADGIVRQVDVSRLGRVMTRGCFGDGTLLFERRSTTNVSEYELLRVDLTGRVLGVVASYAARQEAWRVQIAASGQSVAIADPLTERIDVFGTDGKLRASVRLQEPIEPLTPAERGRLDSPSGTGPSLQSDPRRPLYGPIVLDGDGVLWLQDFVAGISNDVGWTGISIASADIYRFRLGGHPLGQAWPPARLLGIDGRGALFLFTEPDLGAKVFAYFALRPIR